MTVLALGDTKHRAGVQLETGLLCAVVLFLVLGQRLAVPLGGGQQVSLTIAGMLLLCAFGLVRGALTTEPARVVLLGFALSALALVSVVSYAKGQQPSLLSLLLILLIYLPAVAVATDRAAVERALRLFVDLMIGLGAVGLVLFGLQYVGLPYRDYLGEMVPSGFLQQGYNTASPLSYGSSIYRSSGVVFLEPSFFSLFLGLAILVSLRMSHRRLLTPVLAAAAVCSASGNGIVVLAVSLIWVVLFGPERRQVLAVVPPLLAAGVLILVTPLGGLLASRTTEIDSPDTSASLRLVQPYQILLPGYLSTTESALLGNGAGSANRYIEDENGSAAVIAPALPKLLFEYGVVGTLPMLGFLLWTFLRNGSRLPWMAGLLLAYFIVNASLQQPTIAATTYVFLSLLVPVASASQTSTPLSVVRGAGRRESADLA